MLMTAFVLGGTLSQWPLGKLSDKYDRRLVILPTTIACVGTGAVKDRKGLFEQAHTRQTRRGFVRTTTGLRATA